MDGPLLPFHVTGHPNPLISTLLSQLRVFLPGGGNDVNKWLAPVFRVRYEELISQFLILALFQLQHGSDPLRHHQ
jgi:hypothetical protein